ncbi:exodeoxyribonuclease III [Vagococcus zengguangii]|uniref:Exodeoxyribonuclease III n=1 Tax=Vagococcus zengguangii TaxID=2571750 RepID=A0A4D7CTH4_9ENTE|nr:exodeoxyribonuclease III [Vagococcus zengguangii]QCI85666.1 exodeoxyribonuclease III [Vagococcus zengguangii]
MKFISWNVNGLRAVIQKDFIEIFNQLDADFFCLQEIKLQAGQIDLELPDYHQYWNYAVKKGYSGVAIFAKEEALNATYGLGIEEHDQEGRVITLEYPEFFLVTCYTPNAQAKLKRLDYRLSWEEAFKNHLNQLNVQKPVIVCGDLNVAHQNIDLKNWKTNQQNPGFSPQERQAFTNLLAEGYIDTFRHFYPDLEGAYSWWSYRFNARQNNAGWRIDYFLTSESLVPRLIDAKIHADIFGSDHCPVELTIA